MLRPTEPVAPKSAISAVITKSSLRPARMFRKESLPAAVHRQNRAVDKRRLVARQIHDGVADIFPAAGARGWIAICTALPSGLTIRILIAYVAHVDGVTRDAMLRFFQRDGTRQRDDARFCRGVQAHVSRTHRRVAARHAESDDPPELLGAHDRQGRLDAKEG